MAVDPDSGEALDEVLAASMPAPHSYTGEDVLELHCHGSPVVVEAVIACAIRAGARAAEPGEFTRRAVLNGKMDLVQAEAVADLIDAPVRSAAALAWQQLQGALSGRLGVVREKIVSVLADVEANVDFSDEELPDENVPARHEELATARGKICGLLEGFAAARRQREGYRTVVAGRPNVGKSSLVNALLGSGRMIVSDEPGTTRDTVEEVVDLGGMAFVLTDTAGVRAAQSKAEAAAVERALESCGQADLVVVVIDGSEPLHDDDRELLAGLEAPATVVAINKRDLPSRLSGQTRAELASRAARVVETCALTGEGCAELCGVLEEVARGTDELQPAAISRVRHRTALERTLVCLDRADELIAQQGAPELAAIELRGAADELAALVAPLDNEEILDIIFNEFCIGK